MFVCDANGRILRVNPASARINIFPGIGRPAQFGRRRHRVRTGDPFHLGMLAKEFGHVVDVHMRETDDAQSIRLCHDHPPPPNLCPAFFYTRIRTFSLPG
ncbi:MAG: hypothetical protein R6V13_12920 [Anaerolineae bacterium]